MFKVVNGTIYMDGLMFTAYILCPNMSKECPCEEYHKIVIDTIIEGKRSDADRFIKEHRGELLKQLPKKTQCVVCGTLIDKLYDRAGSPKFCDNDKCRAKASYADKKIKDGEFVEGVFKFGHRGNMQGSSIRRIKSNTYEVIYQGKKKKKCGIVTITDDPADVCIGDDLYAKISYCDNEDFEEIGVFGVYLMTLYFDFNKK